MEDLSAYKAILRPSAHTYYHGRKITTATSPSSGPVLLAMLNILESYNLYAQGETALSTHRMLEAFKYGYAFRTEMGDPAYVHNQARMDEIISKDWASCVRQNLSDVSLSPPPITNVHVVSSLFVGRRGHSRRPIINRNSIMSKLMARCTYLSWMMSMALWL